MCKFEFNLNFGQSDDKAANDQGLSTSDWVSFLYHQTSGTSNTIVSLVAILLAGLTLFATRESTGTTEGALQTGAAILGFVWLCIFAYNSLTESHHFSKRLLDRVIEQEITDPNRIRDEWVKRPKGASNFIKFCMLLFGILTVVIFAFGMYTAHYGSEPTPPEPTPPDASIAPFKLETETGRIFYTDNYQLQEGAIVMEGWYDDSGSQHLETLIILGNTVEVSNRTHGQ